MSTQRDTRLRYRVLYIRELHELVKAVEDAAEDGWLPQGGVSTAGELNNYKMQALIKYEPIDDDVPTPWDDM